MLATSSRPSHRERHLFVALTAMAVLVGAHRSVSAVTPEAAPACEALADATAAELTRRIDAALKSRHPDHITRLFAADAVMKGFASPLVREDYAGIRDYFLYFLQFEPVLTFEGRQIETGCNFAVDSGTYVWTLKPRNGAASEHYAIPTRYRMTLERIGATWQISELIEELKSADTVHAGALFALPLPQPARAADVAQSIPAVAGFLKRSAGAAPAPPASAASSGAERPLRSTPRASDAEAPDDPTAKYQQWFDVGR